jgi:hypothetical protein
VNNLKIKIYCVTPEICALIQKVLKKHELDFVCKNVSSLLNSKSQEEIISDCKKTADIVVLDQELDIDFKLKLIQNLKAITFICLPSLNENNIIEKPANVIQISEPFRLSEFEEVLLKIINNKTESDV